MRSWGKGRISDKSSGPSTLTSSSMHEAEDAEVKTEPLPRAAGSLAYAQVSPSASVSPSFLSQGLQPGWLLFPEPLPPLGACRVLLILRPQLEALLGESDVTLQAAVGLPQAWVPVLLQAWGGSLVTAS